MPEWAKRVLAVLAGVTAGLVLAELVLRSVPAHLPIAFDIFARDGSGQLRLQPRAKRRHTSPEWSVRVEINSAGFRDLEAPPRPGQPVVVGVGDSLTFGWGVEYEEAFLTRLEAALGGPDRVRVIKAGIPGTGPTDHLGLLRQLLPALRPAVVILGFFVGNDFDDAAAGGAAQFDVVDGLLVPRGDAGIPGPVDAMRTWLKGHSYLAQFAAQQLWLYERRRAETVPVERREHRGLARRDERLRQFIQVHLGDPFPARLRRGVDGALAALTEMKRLAHEHRARFVLVVIPRSIQVYGADRRRYQEAFGIHEHDWDLDHPQRILEEWGERERAELLDPLPALRRAAQLAPKRLYFFPDSHLTALGHETIAAELLRHFRLQPIRSGAGSGPAAPDHHE